MKLLTKQFGGLSNRAEAHLIGPSQAQDLSNVNLDSKGIRPLNGLGSTVTTGSGTLRSIYKYSSTWITSTEHRQFVEYGGNLFYAVSGGEPKKSSNGTTFYKLGLEAPSSAPSAAENGAGVLNGTYMYRVTYTNAFGSESAPSAAVSITVASKQVRLSSVPVSADAQVTGRKIYRTVDAGGTYLLVGSIADNNTTTYDDNVADASLGAALATAGYGAPGNLDGICVTSYGRLMGWIGRFLYYSEKAKPDAWPSTNSLTFNEDIVAVVPFGGSVLVLTEAAPYLLTGTDNSTYAIIAVPSQQGCVERDTAVDMGGFVFYLSPDGLCMFDGSSVTVISKAQLSDATMTAISATNAKACRYNERYILFHSGGFLEYDPRIDSPWKKGTITANAVHYNRVDDSLYVAVTADIKKWEAGAALTYYYRTGDWIADKLAGLRHHREVYVVHDGAITLDVYLNGTQHGSQQTATRSSMGHSCFKLPMGGFGNYVSVKVGGTGNVREILVDPVDLGNA